AAAAPTSSSLHVTQDSLENARYRVRLNAAGDVASIYDKLLGRELLSAPMRLSFQTEAPSVWPAWNMDWSDQQKPPRAYVDGPAAVRILENGPARVALQITRDAQDSHFVQTVSLAAGSAGDRVVFGLSVDWKTGGSALMADFPLTASAPQATYNWDIGTIARGNDNPRQFEVASHQWVDLTDASGAYGATLLTDVKNGSDKPTDNTLRLTLVYTPGLHNRNYSDQATQDWGHHEIAFGLTGHKDDWRSEGDASEWQAYRLNVPLTAFLAPSHPGVCGREVSLLRTSNPAIRLLAMKRAEDSHETVVRLVELNGQPETGVRVHLAARVLSAREINGQEQPLPKPESPIKVDNGDLVVSFTPYQPRSFALRLAPLNVAAFAATSAPLNLPFDLAAATPAATPSSTGFDGKGDAYPAEMLPGSLVYGGVRFQLGSPAAADALIARGQTVALPPGKFTRLYVLASAIGDQSGDFTLGHQVTPLKIQDWSGLVGQWDYRDWTTFPVPSRRPGGRPREAAIYAGLNPGFIKPAPIAWFASHHHLADGSNATYSYSYLFAYELPIPAGARSLTLPNNPAIRIFSATAVAGDSAVHPAAPLFDVLPYPKMSAAEKAALYSPGRGPDAAFYPAPPSASPTAVAGHH
ncbi:MAG: glycoside hydrolase family 38 C-terminal domain-containing protein, partial [Terriglobales bacterium]